VDIFYCNCACGCYGDCYMVDFRESDGEYCGDCDCHDEENENPDY
jgi:hypothetical protein